MWTSRASLSKCIILRIKAIILHNNAFTVLATILVEMESLGCGSVYTDPYGSSFPSVHWLGM